MAAGMEEMAEPRPSTVGVNKVKMHSSSTLIHLPHKFQSAYTLAIPSES